MKIVKTNLITKNNTQNGFYIYKPIVEVSGKFFFCESIKTNVPTNSFDVSQINIVREIPKEFYLANGL